MLNFLIDDVKINDPLNIFGLNKPKQNVQNNEMANEKEQLIDNQKDLIENQKNEEFVGLEELSKKINLHTQEDIKLNSNESNNKENSNKEQYEKLNDILSEEESISNDKLTNQQKKIIGFYDKNDEKDVQICSVSITFNEKESLSIIDLSKEDLSDLIDQITNVESFKDLEVNDKKVKKRVIISERISDKIKLEDSYDLFKKKLESNTLPEDSESYLQLSETNTNNFTTKETSNNVDDESYHTISYSNESLENENEDTMIVHESQDSKSDNLSENNESIDQSNL